MKKLLLLSAGILSFTAQLQAQTGISAAGTAPDASAMLDVIATDKGFLAPRVALVATNNSLLPIPSPADGLLVYNTGVGGVATKGFYYWDATNSLWQKIQSGNGSFVTGSGTQNYVTKWNNAAGTTIGNSQLFDNGTNVGVGVGSPTASKLQVAGFVSGDDGSGRFSTKWSGDNHHGIWYRATVSADGNTVTTADAVTFREYGSASLGYHFWTGGTTQTERFRITDSYANFITGNVGIGSSAPGASLDIGGNPNNAFRTAYFNLSANNSSVTDRPYFRGTATHLVIAPRTTGASTMYLSYPGDLTGGSTVDTRIQESLFITSTGSSGGGNVGVGLSGPTEKLEVSGAIKMPGASATDNNSPALVLVSDDDFLYDGEYLNHYAMGFHQFNDGAGLGGNTYASGYYGIDLFTGGAQRFRINNNGTVKINNLAGAGTRFVVADASGNLSASNGTSAGVVTGAGTLNYIPKWTPNGSTLGNSLITDDATTITAGGQFDVTGGTGTGYTTAPIEIRTSAIAPRLAFHYSGVVASQIAVENSGRIAIRDNPGTGYENFIARDVYADREIYVNNWVRHNDNDGIYWSNNSWHIYPQDAADMILRTGSGNGGIKGTIADGTARGYIHWTTSNEIGFLNASRNWSLRVDNSGNTFATTSSRAPIFYDNDNTGYYLDPASTSDAAIRIRGGALFGGNTTWGALLYVGTDGRQGLTNSASPSVAATNGNLHMDAGSGYNMYLNYYDGASIYFGRGDNSTRALLDGNGLYLYDGWLRTHGGNGLYFQDYGTGIRGVQADGGSYGSVSSYGAVGGWNGYSTAGRYVLMSDGAQNVGLYNDVDNYWYFLINRLATDNGYQFMNSYTGALNMRIQHTNGTRYASYDGDSNWDFYSDRRLKEHIEHEENILDRLLKLDVVNYHFIDECKEEKEIGFIAQDVEQYFPSLVSEATDARYDFKVKTLGYSSFGVLAVGAIKELKIEKDKEIAELKEEIEKLKSDNATLKTENTVVKSDINTLKAEIELIKADLIRNSESNK